MPVNRVGLAVMDGGSSPAGFGRTAMWGLVSSRNWTEGVNKYQKAVACVQHDSVKLRMGTQ